MDKIQLVSEIERLKKEKNAVIMAHYYQNNDIQNIADFLGDSLALARQAAKTNADIIVLCGVYFMGETAKILSPQKKVLIPDAEAGCSLADSCPADDFKAFIEANPDHRVISYVNTSASVKALTDVVVTSTNAVDIVSSFPANEKIIFGPDRNLGNYINELTGRNMLLWDGACHVHEKVSIKKLIELKKSHSLAKIIAHPECKKAVLTLADFVGSTASLIKYVQKSKKHEFIVVTESGVLYEMKKTCPEKIFIPAPPDDSTCACNECSFMRLNTLEKLYNCLLYERPSIEIPEEIRMKAEMPILKMLELSKKLKI
jgi:quinolinate synthase